MKLGETRTEFPYYPTGLESNADATLPLSARGDVAKSEMWSPYTDRLTSRENTGPTTADEIGEDTAADQIRDEVASDAKSETGIDTTAA